MVSPLEGTKGYQPIERQARDPVRFRTAGAVRLKESASASTLQNKGKGSQIVSVDVQTQPSFMFLRTTPLPIDGIVGVGPRAYDITPDASTLS